MRFFLTLQNTKQRKVNRTTRERIPNGDIQQVRNKEREQQKTMNFRGMSR